MKSISRYIHNTHFQISRFTPRVCIHETLPINNSNKSIMSSSQMKRLGRDGKKVARQELIQIKVHKIFVIIEKVEYIRSLFFYEV